MMVSYRNYYMTSTDTTRSYEYTTYFDSFKQTSADSPIVPYTVPPLVVV